MLSIILMHLKKDYIEKKKKDKKKKRPQAVLSPSDAPEGTTGDPSRVLPAPRSCLTAAERCPGTAPRWVSACARPAGSERLLAEALCP